MKNVAFIMSVYKNDSADMLKGAIDSMLNQTVNCDILMCQDGELPIGLSNVLKSYESNDRITILKNESNKGLAYSLNRLIDYSAIYKYEYLARMDSDDISRPTRVKKQLEFFNKNPEIDVLGSSCREFGSSYSLDEKHLPKYHDELKKFSITRCPFVHPSVMFKTRVFAGGIRYPENTKLTEDMALWFELLVRGKKFANSNEILLDYRLEENTVLRRKGFGKAWSEVTIRLKYMCLLREISFINVILISSRLFFHVMPSKLIKLSYKYMR